MPYRTVASIPVHYASASDGSSFLRLAFLAGALLAFAAGQFLIAGAGILAIVVLSLLSKSVSYEGEDEHLRESESALGEW